MLLVLANDFFPLGISCVQSVFLHDVTNQVKNSYIAYLLSGAVKEVYSTHQMHIHFAEYVNNKLQALNILLLFLLGLLLWKLYQNYFLLFPLSSQV